MSSSQNSGISGIAPNPQIPFVDQNGIINDAWYRFLQTLQLRSGANRGVDSTALAAQVATLAATTPITGDNYADIADVVSVADPDFSNTYMTEPAPFAPEDLLNLGGALPYQEPDLLALRDVTQAPGSATGDSANPGNLGEYQQLNVPSTTPVALTNNTIADVGSFVLTPGNWLVWGVLGWIVAAGTTCTGLLGWTNTASATNPTPPNGGGIASWIGGAAPAGTAPTLFVGMHRLALPASTTIYLSAEATFSGGTLSVYGLAGALRVR